MISKKKIIQTSIIVGTLALFPLSSFAQTLGQNTGSTIVKNKKEVKKEIKKPVVKAFHPVATSTIKWKGSATSTEKIAETKKNVEMKASSTAIRGNGEVKKSVIAKKVESKKAEVSVKSKTVKQTKPKTNTATTTPQFR